MAKKKAKNLTTPEAQAEHTMSSRIVGAVTQTLKTNGGRVWRDLSEAEQSKSIELITAAVEEHVKDAVNFLAAGGNPRQEVIIQQVTFKDGATITLKVPKPDNMTNDIANAVKKVAVLVLSDPDEHVGGDYPKADPDQTKMPLETATEEVFTTDDDFKE